VKGQQDTTANTSNNPTFAEVLSQHVSRRQMLWGGLVAAGATLTDGVRVARCRRYAEASTPLFSFQSIPASQADQVVPPGYTAQILFAWGDPISDGPAFKPDASNTTDEQALQAGMHHDALHFFPLPMGSESSTRGLLAINHEYTDDGLLHVGGMEPWTAEKVAKSQAAHGVSIIEVAFEGNTWKVVRPSKHARRITGRTPMRFSGPAAGHALLQTVADPTGTTVLGTLNNCAHGVTPWGTYLTCEENFNGYFVNASGEVEGVADAAQKASLLKGQVAMASRRRALAIAGTSTTHGSTPPVIHTSRIGSAGSLRLIRSIPRASRSSTPRWAAASTRAPGARSPRITGWSSIWATTSITSISTSL
jgi:secreted PhoX family phosphatase